MLARQPHRQTAPFVLLATTVVSALSGCGNTGIDTNTTANPRAVELGAKLFFEKTLSASGEQSCASCHAPEHAFADPRDVSLGGPNGDLPGFRNAPSLTYQAYTPAFHFDGATPTGGYFLDGRVDSLDEQAIRPFFSAFEMALADDAELAEKIRQLPYS